MGDKFFSFLIFMIEIFYQDVEEENMEVEKIIQKRIVKVRKFEYLVKWKNYDRIEYNTWELADGLEGAEEIINKFEKDLEVKNRSGKLRADKESANTKTDNQTKKCLPVKDQKYQKDSLEVRKGSGKLKSDANNKTDEKLKRTSYARSHNVKQSVKGTEKDEIAISKLKPKRKRMEAVLEKKDSKYLVKWENSPKEENTWELRSAIPLDIIKTYERDLLLKRGKGKFNEIKNDHTDYRNKDKHRQMSLEGKIPELKKVQTCLANAQTEIGVKVKQVKSTNNGNENSDIEDGNKNKESIPEQDDLYMIESLVRKKGSKYFVKWENYAEDQNTWEPRSSIPKDILEKFEVSLKRKNKSSTQENKQGCVDKQANNFSQMIKSNSDKECVKEDDALDKTSFKTKKTVDKDNKIKNILNKELTSMTKTPTTRGKAKLKMEESSCKRLEGKLNKKLVESNTKGTKELKSKKIVHSSKLNKIKRSQTETLLERKVIKKQIVKKVNIASKKKIKQENKQSRGKESMEKAGIKLHQKVNIINPAPIKGAAYNIESLLEKKGSNYLVKWENFPESQNTWEPRSSIPTLIVKVQICLNIKHSIKIKII
jgi:hypothetical protein